jgi:hypothetical protein
MAPPLRPASQRGLIRAWRADSGTAAIQDPNRAPDLRITSVSRTLVARFEVRSGIRCLSETIGAVLVPSRPGRVDQPSSCSSFHDASHWPAAGWTRPPSTLASCSSERANERRQAVGTCPVDLIDYLGCCRRSRTSHLLKPSDEV